VLVKSQTRSRDHTWDGETLFDERSLSQPTETIEISFERMASTFGAAIGRCVRSYAKSAAERQDLEQDIALGIWRALPSFRHECSERTFVLRIAHNQALSSLTRRRGRPQTDELDDEAKDEGPDPEMLADLSQRMRAVFRAIHALPFGQRQVLVLALEGLSHEEIGEVLGISVGNVAVRVSRARADLKKLLGGQS
jgi:RNA polymerase sigma factor (sigma-70 family)